MIGGRRGNWKTETMKAKMESGTWKMIKDKG
jgi:hypothetical protein